MWAGKGFVPCSAAAGAEQICFFSRAWLAELCGLADSSTVYRLHILCTLPRDRTWDTDSESRKNVTRMTNICEASCSLS